MVLLISSTLIIGAIIGFVFVGVAFLRFGWKIGVIDVVLVFIAGNIGLSFCGHLRKK